MLNAPKKIEEAQKIKYGAWAGNPKGNPYNPNQCAYEIFPSSGWQTYQCLRKNGHGINGLFCKQHAKIISKND